MGIAESWAVIHEWLARHHPTMLGLLHGPANPGEFERLEARIGHRLPDDFKASYLIHDGSETVSGIVVGLSLMPLVEVGRRWQAWADIADDEETVADLSEDCQSHPTGAVKPLYANRGWVPFAGDAMNFVALDFDPGPAGRTGQVINAGRDDEIRHVIAGDFAEFLAFVAGLFVAGRVVVNADEPPGAPRWLALAGGRRDLLTGLRHLLGLAQDAEPVVGAIRCIGMICNALRHGRAMTLPAVPSAVCYHSVRDGQRSGAKPVGQR